MKVSIYGAGNQDFYLNELRVLELFGGEPPYGGSRMAIEFAEAGHDVVLSEPHREVLSEEMWDKVEEAGVKITTDDLEAARHGEIHILYTPTIKTLEVAKKIVRHLPKDAVLLTTCTICPVVPYHHLKYELRERKDIGISAFHPAAVPGTPQHDSYIIGGKSLDGKDYLTEEQLKKCIELAESVNKKVYIIPIGAICPTANRGAALIAAIVLAGILEYYILGNTVVKIPKEMMEKDVFMALQTLASIVESSGIEGLFKVLNVELVTKSASSLYLTEDQKVLRAALERLKNVDEELLEKFKKAKINPTTLVAAQELVKELKTIIGGKAVEGSIERSMKKLFMKHSSC
ncbi:H(2)-dependent methylenetetrahydromethanopterin dehydrogenase-related protein [Methanothermococcus sp. SCGC AD-155-E23]|nr:H(2)-dependent methylenetetrahydromethanopterin dehydrogenase-related protein [Methanothermococcus sp. SCGC AD-155-E23]